MRAQSIRQGHILLTLSILILVLAACGSSQPDPDKWGSLMQESLAQIRTVMGHVDLTISQATLKQELWVEAPNRLRTETEVGPPTVQGTIVVLNEKEGWFYNPTLDLALIVDRTDYTPELGLKQGSTLLEVLPSDVQKVLASQAARTLVGGATIAGRECYHLEVILTEEMGIFAPGPLNLWLDKENFFPLQVQAADGLEILFQTVQFNQEIDPVIFEFYPPPGATVRRYGE